MIAYASRFTVLGLSEEGDLLKRWGSVVYEIRERTGFNYRAGTQLYEIWLKDKSVSNQSAYERTYGLDADRNEWHPLRMVTKSYLLYIMVEPDPVTKCTIFTVISAARGVLESVTALMHTLYGEYEKVEKAWASPALFANTLEPAIQSIELYNSRTNQIVSRRFLHLVSIRQLMEDLPDVGETYPEQQLLRAFVIPTLHHLPIELALVGVDYEACVGELWLNEGVFVASGGRGERHPEKLGKLFEVVDLLYCGRSQRFEAEVQRLDGHRPHHDLEYWMWLEQHLSDSNRREMVADL